MKYSKNNDNNSNKNNNNNNNKNNNRNNNKYSNMHLTKSLEENISLFENIFSGDQMFITRRFQNKYLNKAKCCVLYFEGMVNNGLLNEFIIQPILNNDLAKEINPRNLFEEIQYKVIASNNIQITDDIENIVNSAAYGNTILLLEGYDKVMLIDSKGWQTRAVSEPESAKVVRGPREGFTESITINITLVRRKIKDPDMKFKFKEIGTRTRTKTCICYIEGLAKESIVNELERRLDDMVIDGILDSGYIQEYIRDEPFSPYETIGASERPDVIAGKLLEGRVALFVDGSPFVLTVPFLLAEAAQSNEDYYNNYIYSSINRIFRTVSTILSISIPALFLAVTTYHQEMLPTHLLLSIAASREGVPFPTVVSLIIMLLIFDVLREAGTRMPSPVGQTVNIVGTLVLGQAAVEARLVSAPVVIVTALTGILTLMNKNLIAMSMIIRFIFIILTSIIGIYGFVLGFLAVIIHLMSIRSFGVPYTLGLTSFRNHDGQDIWIRAPWWTMTLRPKIIGAKNLVRQSMKKSRRQ